MLSGSVVAYGVTGTSGCATLTIPATGTYDVVVTVPAASYPHCPGVSQSMDLACGDTYTITIAESGSSPSCCLFTVSGCCAPGGVVTGGALGCCASAPVPGATVSITGIASGTTDSNGQYEYCLSTTGTYAWTVSAPRFVTQTGTIAYNTCYPGCQPINVTLAPASGYACGPYDESYSPRPYPVPTTLYLTDSAYGSTTLIYDGYSSWVGSLGIYFPGGCPNTGNGGPVINVCPPTPCLISYRLAQCPVNATLAVSYTTCGTALCFGQYPYWLQQLGCPGPPGGCVESGLLACKGEPNNAVVFWTSGSIAVGTSSGTLAAGIPFDFSCTIPTCTCAFCVSGILADTQCETSDGLPCSGRRSFLYPSGSTLTVTE